MGRRIRTGATTERDHLFHFVVGSIRVGDVHEHEREPEAPCDLPRDVRRARRTL
jgi:hypothetical protein